MPYRSPINTDVSRINFLERCQMQAQNDATANATLIDEATVTEIARVLPEFKTALAQRGKEAADQIPAVAQKDESKSVCTMWISQFFQVLGFWVKRELHDEGVFKYYGLDANEPTVPPLYLDDDVLFWGTQIIQGEANRVAAGGAAMTNPDVEAFKPIYEDFKQKLQAVQKEKNELNTAEEAVNKLRADVDRVVDDAISELEFRLRKIDSPARRRKMRTYGVNYSYRPGESSGDEPVVEEVVSGQ